MKPTIVLTAFTAIVSCMRAPPVCLSNIIELDAGVSFVSASIDGSLTQRCEALVTLDNSEFLPVTYTFDASHCDGSFIASFLVPPDLSAGDGYVFWQCSGQSPACNRIRVKGGQKDPSLALQRQGYVQCASKLMHTPSMTTTTRQSLTASPDTSTGAGGGGVCRSSGRDTAPIQSTTTTVGTSTSTPSAEASSIKSSSVGTASTGVWPTAVVTGTSFNSQRSTSTTPAINDATAISARQTAITSTIFATILLTQTITAIATTC